jgi:hypothetical protein
MAPPQAPGRVSVDVYPPPHALQTLCESSVSAGASDTRSETTRRCRSFELPHLRAGATPPQAQAQLSYLERDSQDDDDDPNLPSPSSSQRTASSRVAEETPPSVNHVRASPSYPILMAASCMAPGSRVLNYDPDDLPVNCSTAEGALKVESPFFSGRVLVYVKDVPGAPAQVFGRQKRRSLVAMQARCSRQFFVFPLCSRCVQPCRGLFSIGLHCTNQMDERKTGADPCTLLFLSFFLSLFLPHPAGHLQEASPLRFSGDRSRAEPGQKYASCVVRRRRPPTGGSHGQPFNDRGHASSPQIAHASGSRGARHARGPSWSAASSGRPNLRGLSAGHDNARNNERQRREYGRDASHAGGGSAAFFHACRKPRRSLVRARPGVLLLLLPALC